MNLISLLQNQEELLSFDPLVKCLEEIEASNVEVIFQNNKYCYLKNNNYYYKIKYRTLNSSLFKHCVEISIADNNFFPIRHTSFIVNNDKGNIPEIPKNCINDDILTYDINSATVSMSVYSYENDSTKVISSRLMKISLLEMKEVFNPDNFLDCDAYSVIENAKSNNDFITELRIKIDAATEGQAFSRLAFGPLRHRFISETIEDKKFVYTLKK